jgi:hypothetical protein
MVYPMMYFILHEYPHVLILRRQQLLKADWWTWWLRWCIATWGLAMPTPTPDGRFWDVG